MKYTTVILILILFLLNSAHADDAEHQLFMPVNFQKAYEKGTRSPDGKPGTAYWQNRADYRINVSFDPKSRILNGSESIKYFNNSPDTLCNLKFHLFANFYKKGNARDFNIDPADLGEGVTIEALQVDGKPVPVEAKEEAVNYEHTSMTLHLDNPLLPGESVQLEISWNYVVNQSSHNRTGGVDSTTFFIAYFYPRIAVYDDIDGWNDFKYTGGVEFYNDFGNYEVSITVPGNFIVWATGTLQNAEEVLQKKYLERYQKAFTSEKIVSIIDSTEAEKDQITANSKRNSWTFGANNVSDFAFALSDHYLWDGTSLIADNKSGRRVFIDAAYDKSSEDFYSVTEIGRKAIKHMCDRLPGYPFPFPAITVFNGADGMEYPMMVNDVSEENMNETIKLTSHEILHSYFPFFVGTNETKYAWMDEGFTSFGDYMIFSALADPDIARFYYLDGYKESAGSDLETPLFTISNYLKRPVYWHNSYPKAAAFIMVLYDLLGPEGFKESLHAFYERWQGKHPTPYDLFNTMMDISGRNLTWLIDYWFFEFGYVDLGILNTQNISSQQFHGKITIKNYGGLPAPVHIRVVFEDNSETLIKKTADVWKDGNKTVSIDIGDQKPVRSLEVLDPTLIDANSINNTIEF